MACGDVVSLESLQTQYKHQIFEAEVITGKAGGVAGGANIGTATNPVTGQTQQTLPSILADLGFDVQSWTSSTGGVLASANQVFLNDAPGSLGLGDYYAWGGTFPKTVPAGTDPALVGSGYIMRSSRLAGTQAREALRRSYAEAGYSLVDGSFEVGGTLVNANDVLLHEASGKAFSGPAGAVAAGTNPASGGFVDKGNETLRVQVYNQTAYFTPESFVFAGETFKDGINDDAIQINRALDYAEAVGGGVVWLSKGKYYQKTQVLIPAGCTLKGSGMYVTTLVALDSMDPLLNNVTTKNNLMYHGWSDGIINTDYTYISGVVVEDLGIDSNWKGRDLTGQFPSTVQACGIKYTSALDSRISRCLVKNAALHAYDVAAMTYFADGDYTHTIAGGSERVLIEGCVGFNSRFDDIFTCHHSYWITFRDCHAYNNDPDMVWANNQHGFEVDDGCQFVLVENCVADYFMAGFQAKGHTYSIPARDVVFNRCHAKNCVHSFLISHMADFTLTKGKNSRGVAVVDCISENANDDDNRYPGTGVESHPRAIHIRSYAGVKIQRFTVIGGAGPINISYYAENVEIDGVTWMGGYRGAFNYEGLINITSGETKGGHSISNVNILDPVGFPVIRCPDSGATFTSPLTIKNIRAVGSDPNVPLVYISLLKPHNISELYATGFSGQLFNTAAGPGWSLYTSDLSIKVEGGLVRFITPSVPVVTTHPQLRGSTAIALDTGKMYYVAGSSPTAPGTWKAIGT